MGIPMLCPNPSPAPAPVASDDTDIPSIQLGTANTSTEASSATPLVTPATSNVNSKCKQPAQPSDGTSSSKWPCVGEALNGMGSKLDDFTDMFWETMSGKRQVLIQHLLRKLKQCSEHRLSKQHCLTNV